MEDLAMEQIFKFCGIKPWHMPDILSSVDPEAEARKHVHDEQIIQVARSIQMRQDCVVILLGGTSGSGKSTLSSLLASRLGLSTVISTDMIRQWLRSSTTEAETPVLFSSSYNSNTAHNASLESDSVLESFERQNELIRPHIVHLISKHQERKQSCIVEGVHLSIQTMLQLLDTFDCCVPFMIHISNPHKHAERFAIRAKYMTLAPKENKYIKHFHNIRHIQDYLTLQASANMIPQIDNTNMDRSLGFIHRVMLDFLLHIYKMPQPLVRLSSLEKRTHLTQILQNIRANQFWSSKATLRLIRESHGNKQSVDSARYRARTWSGDAYMAQTALPEQIETNIQRKWSLLESVNTRPGETEGEAILNALDLNHPENFGSLE